MDFIPRDFFYRQKQSGTNYGSTMPGQPDVNRLLSGRDWLMKPSLTEVQKPKKLILSDWRASTWSNETIENIQYMLADLMAQDFEIFLWQTDQVIRLHPNELYLLENSDVRDQMMPSYPDEMIQAAGQQQRLTADQILILDDYWLKNVFQSYKVRGNFMVGS